MAHVTTERGDARRYQLCDALLAHLFQRTGSHNTRTKLPPATGRARKLIASPSMPFKERLVLWTMGSAKSSVHTCILGSKPSPRRY